MAENPDFLEMIAKLLLGRRVVDSVEGVASRVGSGAQERLEEQAADSAREEARADTLIDRWRAVRKIGNRLGFQNELKDFIQSGGLEREGYLFPNLKEASEVFRSLAGAPTDQRGPMPNVRTRAKGDHEQLTARDEDNLSTGQSFLSSLFADSYSPVLYPADMTYEDLRKIATGVNYDVGGKYAMNQVAGYRQRANDQAIAETLLGMLEAEAALSQLLELYNRNEPIQADVTGVKR